MRTRGLAVAACAALLSCSVALASSDASASDGPGHDERARTQLAIMPRPTRAPENAPNVLLVMTDDVGFAAASTFGGPIPTPNLDRLAASGLRYNRFHTAAICSPTRAALLTGRNPHAVSAGTITDLATAHPGYWSRLPRSAATIAEVLRLNGYNTAMFGKHHNAPNSELSAAGPFDHWPTGLGFEYFYGFVGGDVDQWRPRLFRGTWPAEPRYNSDPTYILDRDLADEALAWIRDQKAAAPDKPFFVYFAPGSAHAPHQAPREWIDRFRGRFDQGWDRLREESLARQKKLGIVPKDTKLTPRPAAIPAWSSLGPVEKRVHARMMEVYAGMLAHQDHQFGRILAELERMGEADDTFVIFIEGDNGSSAEGGLTGNVNEIGALVNGVKPGSEWLLSIAEELGGPNTYGHFAAGWAWATNAPFQWTKQVASHFGATRNGLVISWPRRIRTPGLRSQFHFVADVMPTILEAIGLQAPAVANGVRQQPVDGISMIYTFDAPDAPDRRHTQYFEQLGNRAIYHDGWLANTMPQRMPWETDVPAGSPEHYRWELYDVRRDFSQSRDLSASNPQKLRELQALFDEEARRNHVFPLDDRMGHDRGRSDPGYDPKRKRFVYWAKDVSVHKNAAPPTVARSFSVTAEVIVPEAGGAGALVATGSRFGGWSFQLEDGRPVLHYAVSQHPGDQFRVTSNTAVQPGPATLRFDFDYDGGGIRRGGLARISIDGESVASGRIDRTFVVSAGIGETFDIGRDTGVPVCLGSGPFNGEVRKVEVELR